MNEEQQSSPGFLRAAVCRLVDRLVICSLTMRMPGPRGLDPQWREANELLNQPDFFLKTVPAASVEFENPRAFHFPSSIITPYAECNQA